MQTTNVNCPLQNCNFKKLKGNWNCCVCNKGPNTQGWCTVPRSVQDWNPITRRYEVMETACGHGCCSNCTRAPSSRESSPEVSFHEGRNNKSGRKSHGSSRSSGHKRSTTYDYTGGFPAVAEEEDPEAAAAAAAAAATATSPRSRGSRKSGHDTSADHSSKRTKASGSKGSSHKGRKHH
ncbi:hypothetical protein MGN70_002587 [Eutypa lata]|nr:hypothetical protein MGN70_002587 [Eutypa lata]